MKIIHFSDTHVGMGDNAARFQQLVDDLIRNPPDVPQHCLVLHTGDIIDAATPDNRQAAQQILARLGDAGYRVILCPGNHDYGNKYCINHEAAQSFQQAFAPYLFWNAPHSYPVVHHLNDEVAVIGLDSNAAELNVWQGLFAEGYLGSVQLSALNRLLDDATLRGKKIILYLHHHPFYYGYSVMPDVGDGHFRKHLVAWLTRPFRRMKDAYSLCQIIRDRVQLVLYGHMHEGLDCSGESRKYGIRLALDGSSSTDTDRTHDRMRYRIIDLESMNYAIRMVKMS